MSTAKQLRSLVLFTILAFLCSFGIELHAQCRTQVWNTTRRSANLDQFQLLVPAKMQPSFEARLTQTDWLIFYENTSEDVGPHDEGFIIVRNGHTLLQKPLNSVPEWKAFAEGEEEDNLPAFGISVAQICNGENQALAIGFQACCDTSSALLFFIAIPEGNTYRVSTLPMVNGGELEISQSFPLRFRLWNSTDDGECNACPQHFTVSNYRLANNAPLFVNRFTPSKRFQVFQFDPNRIVLLPADH